MCSHLRVVCFSHITDIHANRPHEGQQLSARALRALLDSKIHPSEIMGKIPCNSAMT